jgi:hypothetical protein
MNNAGKAAKLQNEQRKLYASISGRDRFAADVKPVVRRILAIDSKIQKLSALVAQGAS